MASIPDMGFEIFVRDGFGSFQMTSIWTGPTFLLVINAHPFFVMFDIDRLADKFVMAGYNFLWEMRCVSERQC